MTRLHVIALLTAALALAACESDGSIAITAVGADTTATDALGRTLTFPRPPARILTLAPNLTEIVYTVGAGARLVAASQSDDFPAATDTLPRYSTFPLDHEAIVALGPTLLLATDQVNSPADAEPFDVLGIPTYFFSFDRVADVPAALRTAGALLDGDGELPARLFEAAVDSISVAVEDAPRPKTLLLVGDDVLYAFGRDTYASEAVRIAGGDNLTDTFDAAAPVVSDEWVLEAAPEAIVVLVAGYDPARLLERHPTWRNLPAVRTERVYGLDPDLLSRPGPRLAQGIAQLAALLHPQQVEG